MGLVHGDRSYIERGSSFFEKFISRKSLYVDKTRFIEHVLDRTSEVLLITRPRRMGKSLNLDTLKTFLDCTRNTSELFNGLYVESSSVWAELNKYPVIYLDFKELQVDNYKQRFRDFILKLITRYLYLDQLVGTVKRYYYTNDFSTAILYDFCEALYTHYGVKPYLIIDEYDNLFMNSIGASGFEDYRQWLQNVLSSALKGNEFLEKVVLTGVNRIAQESLFSGLNNLTVYDVFTSSKFDTDFGLTEDEVVELIPDTEERKKVKEWYNGFRVGNSEVYNIYSVMSYLSFGRFDNYWGLSGVMELLEKLMSEKEYYAINCILEEGFGVQSVQPRLTAEDIVSSSPSAFWGLAVQTGYLAHRGYIPYGLDYMCELSIPNLELRDIWKWFILRHVFGGYDKSILEALINIQDSSVLAELLGKFLMTKLSYFDIDKSNYENNYHNLLLGMFSFRGFEVISNRESGMGRYDLLVKMPRQYIIFEFKVVKEGQSMKSVVDSALNQIDEKKYWSGLETSLPIYKVGIAFEGKQCTVKSVLHDSGI